MLFFDNCLIYNKIKDKEMNMNNLMLAFNVVFPLFLMMALGYFIRKIELIDEKSLQKLNGIVFKVLLPLMVFYNIYTTNREEALNFKLILFAFLSIIVVFGVLFIMIPKLEKDNKRRGVLIQGIFRSNFMIFGIPVVRDLYGQAAVGSASLLLGFIVPVFNVLAVVALAYFKQGKIDKKSLVKEVLKNPFIIASLLGLLALAMQVKLPLAMHKTIADVSASASPLALIVLGGLFKFNTIKGCVKQIVIGVVGKLILVPMVFIIISMMLGYRGVDLACLMVIFGSPVSVSSFAMAQQMDGDAELAGHLVVFGSLCSVITLFMWIFILKQLTMI